MFKPLKTGSIRQITTPDEYHKYGEEFPRGDKRRVMSRSQLWEMRKCPRKWLLSAEKEPTDAMEFGDLVDCLLLTPDLSDVRFAVEPSAYGTDNKPWTYQAKECKAWKVARHAEGRTVVSSSVLGKAQKAVRRFLDDPYLAGFLKASDTQVMVLAEWHDEETGLVIPCKALMDAVPFPTSQFGDTLADLKTARDATFSAWVRAIHANGYDYQGAFYLDIMNGARGTEYRQFEHLIIENEAPFEPTHRMLSDDWISDARGRYRTDLRNYCEALMTGEWAGYDTWASQPEAWMVLNS